MSTNLTLKQEKFCNKYLECGNASEAYRYAYNANNMKGASVNRKATELLDHVKVSARIAEMQLELRKKTDLTKERILTELKAILDSNISDYVKFDGTKVSFTPFTELNEKQLKAIESIKEGKNGIELKLHGKSWTIVQICRLLGYDNKDDEQKDSSYFGNKELTKDELKNKLTEIENSI